MLKIYSCLKRWIPIAAALFAMILVATSCRSSKGGQSGNTGQYEATSGTMTQKQAQERLDAIGLAAKAADWQRVNVPVSVKVDGLPLSLSGNLVMERGKSVYVSLRVLGMEAAFASLTTDSILVVDKYHGRYVAAPLSAITSKIPLSISDIQQVLTGGEFILGGGSLAKANKALALERISENGAWSLAPATGAIYGYSFIFTADDILEKLVVTVGDTPKATVDYADGWAATPHGTFPQRLDASVAASAKNAMNATVKFTYKKAKWDGDVTLPGAISVPSGCQQLDSSSLLKMLVQ